MWCIKNTCRECWGCMDCQTEESETYEVCQCCREPIAWDEITYYDEFYGTVCEKCHNELEEDE